MSDDKKRTFNEDEVGRLLQLAIKQQEADHEATRKLDHGLTIGEVERIAAEAGIDEKYIRYALLNLNKREPQAFEAGIWGSPTVVEADVDIPGTLSEEAMIEMLAEIRASYNQQRGNFEQLKNSFAWSTSTTLVQAQPLEDMTRISVREKMDNYLVLTHFWEFLAIFMGFIISLATKNPVAISIVISTILTLFFSARWLMGRFFTKRRTVVDELLDKLTAIAHKHQEHVSDEWSYGEQTPASAQPLLNLDDAKGYNASESKNKTTTKTKS